jgi:hypothetical protein
VYSLGFLGGRADVARQPRDLSFVLAEVQEQRPSLLVEGCLEAAVQVDAEGPHRGRQRSEAVVDVSVAVDVRARGALQRRVLPRDLVGIVGHVRRVDAGPEPGRADARGPFGVALARLARAARTEAAVAPAHPSFARRHAGDARPVGAHMEALARAARASATVWPASLPVAARHARLGHARPSFAARVLAARWAAGERAADVLDAAAPTVLAPCDDRAAFIRPALQAGRVVAHDLGVAVRRARIVCAPAVLVRVDRVFFVRLDALAGPAYAIQAAPAPIRRAAATARRAILFVIVELAPRVSTGVVLAGSRRWAVPAGLALPAAAVEAFVRAGAVAVDLTLLEAMSGTSRPDRAFDARRAPLEQHEHGQQHQGAPRVRAGYADERSHRGSGGASFSRA